MPLLLRRHFACAAYAVVLALAFFHDVVTPLLRHYAIWLLICRCHAASLFAMLPRIR